MQFIACPVSPNTLAAASSALSFPTLDFALAGFRGGVSAESGVWGSAGLAASPLGAFFARDFLAVVSLTVMLHLLWLRNFWLRRRDHRDAATRTGVTSSADRHPASFRWNSQFFEVAIT